MKRILIIAVLVAIAFASCKKDDDFTPLVNNTITAQVEKGKDYNSVFSSVKVKIYYLEYYNGNYFSLPDSDYFEAASDYVNGGFSLTLPETLEARCLMPIANLLYFDSGAKISDRSARGIYTTIEGYDKDGKYVDDFIYRTPRTTGDFWYVDRDVKITGEDNYNLYNMDLKKGWNIVYFKSNGQGYKGSNITEAQKGLKWYRKKDIN
jgi:hypothetical protein